MFPKHRADATLAEAISDALVCAPFFWHLFLNSTRLHCVNVVARTAPQAFIRHQHRTRHCEQQNARMIFTYAHTCLSVDRDVGRVYIYISSHFLFTCRAAACRRCRRRALLNSAVVLRLGFFCCCLNVLVNIFVCEFGAY